MSSPNATTPLFPSSAIALAVADTDFSPGHIYVGGLGSVVVVPAEGPSTATVTFAAVPPGTVIPCQVKGIKSSGTTATNLVLIR